MKQPLKGFFKNDKKKEGEILSWALWQAGTMADGHTTTNNEWGIAKGSKIATL